MSEICRLGFIPEDLGALHKVQLWGWHGSAPEAGTTGGRVGRWMACVAGLGLFMPWKGSCHQNCQLSSDRDKASAEGNVRERKEEREASARGLEQWALSQGERQAGLSHTSQMGGNPTEQL